MLKQELTASLLGARRRCCAWACAAAPLVTDKAKALLWDRKRDCILVYVLVAAIAILGAGKANSATTTPKPVPVLVVPGILGCLSTCLFVDPASGQPCPASKDYHYTYGSYSYDGSLTPAWVLNPTTETQVYQSLVTTLTNAGLKVFPAPYDWRLTNQTSAQTFLKPMINQALQDTPGSAKVDIVAHSMGGLVQDITSRSSTAKKMYENLLC
jgi:hypothetical protein